MTTTTTTTNRAICSTSSTSSQVTSSKVHASIWEGVFLQSLWTAMRYISQATVLASALEVAALVSVSPVETGEYVESVFLTPLSLIPPGPHDHQLIPPGPHDHQPGVCVEHCVECGGALLPARPLEDEEGVLWAREAAAALMQPGENPLAQPLPLPLTLPLTLPQNLTRRNPVAQRAPGQLEDRGAPRARGAAPARLDDGLDGSGRRLAAAGGPGGGVSQKIVKSV
eukprot:scaffold52343_cov56-Phaeocystis_antarctica.AAC.1